MSEQAIQTVNLEDAAKQLREKIRLAFVDLIPPEQWDAMVKTELEAFTKPRPPERDQWGHVRVNERPSVFHEVAEQVYREHLKELVKAELQKPEWCGQWDSSEGRYVFGEKVNAWLTENSAAIMHTMLREMFGAVAQGMVERLRNGM
jgi:hypothetical protein